jgi:predicted enzyme related to lactoylglutathione lyase
MSEQVMPANGSFCWNELSTTDDAAAIEFYTKLLGWQVKTSEVSASCEGAGDAAGAPVVYNEIVVGGRHVGGIYKAGTESGGAPPHWMSYIAVDDVDEKAKRVTELGGSVCVPPTDIPNTGRFCVINDPTGATISLITLSGAHS